MPAERRRRLRSSHDGEDEGNWLVTYSDTITLLLCFFVMLFALSSLDVQKFNAMLASFQGAVGILDGGRSLSTEDGASDGPGLMDSIVPDFWREPIAGTDAEPLYDDLVRIIADEELGDTVQVAVEERGIVVRFSESVLFDLGKAELKPEFREVLERFAAALLPWEHPIRVEGHTDYLPIHNEEFASNWELSAIRATTVTRFLLEQGLDPKLLSAVAYSEYHPIASNLTEEGRAQNRRVDIVLLWDSTGLEGQSPNDGGE